MQIRAADTDSRHTHKCLTWNGLRLRLGMQKQITCTVEAKNIHIVLLMVVNTPSHVL
jgi:hypothetical protein